MGPSGSAVDSLSGFLTRGALACALGLVHNHLVCLSDHSLHFFISHFKYGLEVHLRILKGKHRTRPYTLGTGSGLPRGCHFVHRTPSSSPRLFSKEALRVTELELQQWIQKILTYFSPDNLHLSHDYHCGD